MQEGRINSPLTGVIFISRKKYEIAKLFYINS
jgi:hypothetical protein